MLRKQEKKSKFGIFPTLPRDASGCPLSPLLFAIVIESLSIALKAEKEFKGIQRWGIEHTVSLYADYLLLYIRDPLTSIPHIISTLNSFSAILGYKLNIQKSECFPVNQLATEIPQSSIPFKLSS